MVRHERQAAKVARLLRRRCVRTSFLAEMEEEGCRRGQASLRALPPSLAAPSLDDRCGTWSRLIFEVLLLAVAGTIARRKDSP